MYSLLLRFGLPFNPWRQHKVSDGCICFQTTGALRQGRAAQSNFDYLCVSRAASFEPDLGARLQGPFNAQLLRLSGVLLCRFDMFSVKLHRVKFDANERSYLLQSLLKDEPEQKKRYPYRYPGRAASGEIKA